MEENLEIREEDGKKYVVLTAQQEKNFCQNFDKFKNYLNYYYIKNLMDSPSFTTGCYFLVDDVDIVIIKMLVQKY